MSKTISTRLSDEEVQRLEQIAQKEKLDRSALIRKFLLQKLEEYKIKEFGELYRKGIVSLQEAATGAQVPYYQMMEYIQQEHIRPPTQSREDFQQEIQKSMKILKL
jgi:predicted HTH domain antitoxin